MGNKFAKKFQVLFIGLDDTGKSTALHKMQKPNENIIVTHTIGFNAGSFKIGDAKLTVYDLSGSDRVRPLHRHFFQSTNGLVLFVDSSDRDRIEYLNSEIIKQLLSEKQIENLPLLIFANKQDKAAMSIAELSDRLALDKLHQKNWIITPCVATTGEGLAEGLTWLVEQMRTSRAVASPTNT